MRGPEFLNLTGARRTPYIAQSEAAECGLACIAMVAAFHGYETDLGTLRQRFSFSLTLNNALSYQVIVNLFRHLVRLPLPWFEKRHVGDIISRFGSTQPITTLLSQGLIASLIDGIMALITLSLMFVYAPVLSLLAIGALLAYIGLRLAFLQAMKLRNVNVITANAQESSTFEAAARTACIADDIDRLPMRYQTLVGDMGSVFSGGQKQRILLARAVYGRPAALFFDEGTSQLDERNQEEVLAAIHRLDVLAVMVAHRSSALAHCSRALPVFGGIVGGEFPLNSSGSSTTIAPPMHNGPD